MLLTKSKTYFVTIHVSELSSLNFDYFSVIFKNNPNQNYQIQIQVIYTKIHKDWQNWRTTYLRKSWSEVANFPSCSIWMSLNTLRAISSMFWRARSMASQFLLASSGWIFSTLVCSSRMRGPMSSKLSSQCLQSLWTFSASLCSLSSL